MFKALPVAVLVISLSVVEASAAKSGVGELDRGYARLIVTECKSNGLLRGQCAYVLATAFHETGGQMVPVRETFATSDTQAVTRLDTAWAKGRLPWVSAPYWRQGWFGRGFAQLTHENNYRKASIKLGINLVSDPTKALVPETAAKVLVIGSKEGWFSGKKLEDYIDLQATDFTGARQIINGTDCARKIAAYAIEYDAILKQDGYSLTDSKAKVSRGSGTL
jgi:hypothetical protein